MNHVRVTFIGLAALGLIGLGGCWADGSQDDGGLSDTNAEIRIATAPDQASECNWDLWEVTVSSCDIDPVSNMPTGPLDLIETRYVRKQEGVLTSSTSLNGLYPGGPESHYVFGDELLFGLTPDTCYWFEAHAVIDNGDGTYSPSPNTIPGNDYTLGIPEGTTETNLLVTFCDSEQLAAKDVVVIMANTPLITDIDLPDTKFCNNCEMDEICMSVAQLDWDDVYGSIDVYQRNPADPANPIWIDRKEFMIPMNADMTGYDQVCSSFGLAAAGDYFADVRAWTSLMDRYGVAQEQFTLDFYANECRGPVRPVAVCFDDSTQSTSSAITSSGAAIDASYDQGKGIAAFIPNAVLTQINSLSAMGHVDYYSEGTVAVLSLGVSDVYTLPDGTYFNAIASANVTYQDLDGVEYVRDRQLGVVSSGDYTGSYIQLKYNCRQDGRAVGALPVDDRINGGDGLAGGCTMAGDYNLDVFGINEKGELELLPGITYYIGDGIIKDIPPGIDLLNVVWPAGTLRRDANGFFPSRGAGTAMGLEGSINAAIVIPQFSTAASAVEINVGTNDEGIDWVASDALGNTVLNGTGSAIQTIDVPMDAVAGVWQLNYTNGIDDLTSVTLTVNATYEAHLSTTNTTDLTSSDIVAGNADYNSIHDGAICDYRPIDVLCAERNGIDLSAVPTCSDPALDLLACFPPGGAL